MKLFTKALTLGLMMAGAAAIAPAQASYNLTLCGASPGGLWSLLGAGIDGAVKEAHPGSTVTYQTSGGGFANVVQLQQKKCDLAIIHDAEARNAIKGEKPFSSAMDHLRTIAVLYTWAPEQFIMRKDFAEKHGIKSMETLAEKKIPINLLLNRRGNVVSQIGESMLRAAGASPEDIKSWGGSATFAASREQSDLMRDRRADAMLNSLFVGHGSIKELANAIDLVLIPISDETAQKVAEEWNISEFTIPGGSYEWAPEDTKTVTVSAQLFVNKDADPQMVKDVTAALIEHVNKLQSVHKAMAPLTPELMAGGKAAPYHPAAAEIYKEKGL